MCICIWGLPVLVGGVLELILGVGSASAGSCVCRPVGLMANLLLGCVSFGCRACIYICGCCAFFSLLCKLNKRFLPVGQLWGGREEARLPFEYTAGAYYIHHLMHLSRLEPQGPRASHFLYPSSMLGRSPGSMTGLLGSYQVLCGGPLPKTLSSPM